MDNLTLKLLTSARNIEYLVEYYLKHDRKNYFPSGTFNKEYWYPDIDEECACCRDYRPTTNLRNHCTSKEHIKNWLLKQNDPNYKSPLYFTQSAIREAIKMTIETAPLYLENHVCEIEYVRDHLLGYHLESHEIPKSVVGFDDRPADPHFPGTTSLSKSKLHINWEDRPDLTESM